MGMMHKRIACACGAAIASSSSIKYQLEEFFEREGINGVELICCRFAELEEYCEHVNVIVTASPIFRKYSVPVISDTCYLSGIDCEPTNRKILKLLLEEPQK